MFIVFGKINNSSIYLKKSLCILNFKLVEKDILIIK